MLDAELYEQCLQMTRRELLQRTTTGIGAVALGALIARDARGGEAAGGARGPDFAPRARSVIYLHMVGAPSHLDLFDHKPVLKRHDGRPVPESLIEGQRFAFLRGRPNLLASPYEFQRAGENGMELSSLLPHLQDVAGDVCLIRSIHTDEFNHGPAQLFLQTGFERFGRPSLGAWTTYGLGSMNENLPGFVVLVTGSTPGAGNSLWGSGFLPTVHQGVEFRTRGDPVLFLSNPEGVSAADRRRLVERLRALNTIQLDTVGDPEIATRISQYELAYRMQTSVPGLMDIRREPQSILEMYGAEPGKRLFANNCLIARRLVERGVRFVQLFDQGWDHHSKVFTGLPRKCRAVDRPIAALIKDLKARGLLDETLVVWGAEFGRTPMMQGARRKGAGRDHHKDAYTLWLAGGGVKGGYAHGVTDDLGYHIASGPVHVHDFNATILHLLGLDHEKLTFKFQGRDFRLTDVEGDVVEEVLA